MIKIYDNFPEASIMKNMSNVHSIKYKYESLGYYLQKIIANLQLAAAHGHRRISDCIDCERPLAINKEYYKKIAYRLREIGYKVIIKGKYTRVIADQQHIDDVFYIIDVAW